MSKDKSKDEDRFDNRLGNGRVADKKEGTVHSPNKIDELKQKSDEGRERKKR